MTVVSFRDRLIITSILGCIFILMVLDVWKDWNAGATSQHLLIEIFVAVIALLGLIYIWIQNRLLVQQVGSLSQTLENTRADAAKWKKENTELLKGLSVAIDRQFEDWHFSKAEKEIALLLLKGLSLKEIAELRNTTERTVRQQTVMLYQKSHLSGRAELSAYFLEDLF